MQVILGAYVSTHRNRLLRAEATKQAKIQCFLHLYTALFEYSWHGGSGVQGLLSVDFPMPYETKITYKNLATV